MATMSIIRRLPAAIWQDVRMGIDRHRAFAGTTETVLQRFSRE